MDAPLHVLILEDRPADAELMVQQLGKAGFAPEWRRVDTERDYVAALESSLDVILADHSLPQYTSARALEQLRQRGLEIPIIIVSGTIDEELAVALMKQGAADYVRKDRMARLGQAVVNALEQKRLRLGKQQAEQALVLFRTLLDRTNDAIEIIDPETGRFLDVNDKACTTHGYSRAEYLSMSVPDVETTLQHWSTPTFTAEERQAGSKIFLGRHRRKDGSTFPVEVNVNLIQMDRAYIVSVVRDISERERAEATLRASEERFRRITVNMLDMVSQTDAAGIIQYATPSNQDVLGYRLEDLVGQSVFSFIHPEDRERAAVAFQAGLGTRTPRRGEFRFRHTDGHYLWLESVGNILYDDDGQICGTVLASRDITERKRVEEQLLLREAALKSAANSIAITDRQGTIAWVNEAFTHLTGYQPEELVGQHPRLFKSGQQDPSYYENLWTTILAGKVWRGEMINRRKDGTLYTDETTITPVRADGAGVSHFIAIKQDVTERKRTEEALRASEEHFRSLFDNMLNGFAYCRVEFQEGRLHDWTYLEVNAAFGALTGLENVIGRSVTEILPDIREVDPELFELYGRVVLSGIPEKAEIYSRALAQWLSLSLYSPDKDHFVAVFDVITERKQAADRELHALRRQAEQARAVAAISASPALLEGDVERFACLVTEEACRVAGVERANAWLFNEAATELRCIDLYEATARRHSAGTILNQQQFQSEFRVLKSVPFVIADDAQNDPRTAGYVEAYLKPLGITSMLDAVIRISDKLIGLLCFEHVGKEHHWEPDEVTFACQLADKIGLAIINRERRCAQERLRASEAKLSAISAAALDAIIMIDSDGNVVFWNPAAAAILGYSSAEIVGQNLHKLLAPRHYHAEFEKGLAAFKHTGQGPLVGKTLEVRAVHRDGHEFPVEVSLGAIRLRDEWCAVGILRDISERKRMEESLRLSEEHFRNAFDCAGVSMGIMDLSGRFLRVNPAACRMLGYTEAELLGSNFQTITHPDDQSAEQESMSALVAGKLTTYQIEKRNIDKAGHILWVLKTASLIRDREGRPLQILVQIQDITGRKQAEQNLRNSEERFALAVEGANDGIWDWNLVTNEVYFSPRWKMLIGYEDHELASCYTVWEQRLHPDDRAPTLALLQDYLEGRSPSYQPEFRLRHKDGSYRWILARAAAVRDANGKPIRLTGSHTDITWRKQAEEELRTLNHELEQRVLDRTAQLEAANKELEAFAYSVSHDLRAPLRGIDGFSQALLEDYHDKLDADGQDCLRRVRAASQRMGRLIDDILELSRMTRSAMNRESVDLSAIATRVVAELQAADPTRHVEVCLTSDLRADGDARLLEIVLSNLLGNAWKFTSKTEHARIEFGVTEHAGQRAFFVRDNGAGFDMTYADRLFGAFQRLHTEEEFPGTGIGLATVQRIIHRHGGRVWAEGAVGRGATIYFAV